MNFEDRKIEVSKLPKVDSFEGGKIESSLCLSFDKIKRVANNDILLHVHFKQHESDGKRAKHSVHLKLSLPGKVLVASETDWNLMAALQKALNVLEREATESVKRR